MPILTTFAIIVVCYRLLDSFLFKEYRETIRLQKEYLNSLEYPFKVTANYVHTPHFKR